MLVEVDQLLLWTIEKFLPNLSNQFIASNGRLGVKEGTSLVLQFRREIGDGKIKADTNDDICDEGKLPSSYLLGSLDIEKFTSQLYLREVGRKYRSTAQSEKTR